ncbi:hypothetical protein [Bartonella acomydis]|uniref:Uncharacterized protein n=1 Tax=Bartonella acomydis TaxID=686234 RepID=A0ABP9MS79_9HYPH
MNLKYIITAFATFFSISVAQGASFLSAQKLGQGISSTVSSESFFSKKQFSDTLSEVLQTEFSCVADSQQKAAVELVPVSYLGKRRGYRPKHPRPRPNLFNRDPMSYK